jgi:hypothetical protein
MTSEAFAAGDVFWAPDPYNSGNNPEKTSYCSPWVLATVKHDSVAGSQGAVSEEFTRTIVRRASDYLTQDLGVGL